MTFNNSNLLGETLYQAGLISDLQRAIALEDRQDSKHLRLGEIMALRGWIKQETADFFAEEWHVLLNQTEKHPLGYYLERSGLLTQQQISLILEEQKQIWVKFGSVAVLQGIIAQDTVDFFLNTLFPLESLDSPLIGKKDIIPIRDLGVKEALVVENTQLEPKQEIDLEDIPWIG